MMKNALVLLILLLIISCSKPQENQSNDATSRYKVPVYGWVAQERLLTSK